MQDCNSDPFGNAYVDSCGICAGGGTQRIPTTSCNPEAGQIMGWRGFLLCAETVFIQFIITVIFLYRAGFACVVAGCVVLGKAV